MNQANKNLTSRDLIFLRRVAVKADNNALVELTDRVCAAKDEEEIESLLPLYRQEFPDDALVSGIWCNARVRRWLGGTKPNTRQ